MEIFTFLGILDFVCFVLRLLRLIITSVWYNGNFCFMQLKTVPSRWQRVVYREDAGARPIHSFIF